MTHATANRRATAKQHAFISALVSERVAAPRGSYADHLRKEWERGDLTIGGASQLIEFLLDSDRA